MRVCRFGYDRKNQPFAPTSWHRYLKLVLLPIRGTAWNFAASAAVIQVSAVLSPSFSRFQLTTGSCATVPQDWRAQNIALDGFHAFRTLGLIGSFVLLTLSLAVR
jgi:hypothetical protein